MSSARAADSSRPTEFPHASAEYFHDYTHRTIFTDRSLGDFLAASGYPIEHVQPRFLPLTMKSRLSFGHAPAPFYLRLPYRPLAGQMLVSAARAGAENFPVRRTRAARSGLVEAAQG